MVVEQRANGLALVVMRRHTAQEHVVTAGQRREVDAVDQVGVELLARGEDHAQQVDPLSSQHPRPRIGAVADLFGGLAYPQPCRGAGTGHVTHHDRHQRPGHPRALGDIGKCRPVPHAQQSRTF